MQSDRESIAIEAQLHGPWRFRMLREGAVVADGVRFCHGSCVLQWRGSHPSVVVHDNFDSVVAVHGHDNTSFEWIDERPSDAFYRGLTDCYQDTCEGCPFASVGGLGARRDMKPPKYVADADRADYLAGYRAQARLHYGVDWATYGDDLKPLASAEAP